MDLQGACCQRGIIGGLRRGERECIKPRASDAELCDQEMGRITQLDRNKCNGGCGARQGTPHEDEKSHFEKFVTEGNEKADDLEKAGAMLDEGFMVEAKAEAMQQKRQEVYATLQYAASFHCLVEERKDCEELKPKPKEKWIFVDQKKEGRNIERSGARKPTSIGALRVGKSSKYMKMSGTCTGPTFLSQILEVEKASIGRS